MPKNGGIPQSPPLASAAAGHTEDRRPRPRESTHLGAAARAGQRARESSLDRVGPETRLDRLSRASRSIESLPGAPILKKQGGSLGYRNPAAGRYARNSKSVAGREIISATRNSRELMPFSPPESGASSSDGSDKGAGQRRQAGYVYEFRPSAGGAASRRGPDSLDDIAATGKKGRGRSAEPAASPRGKVGQRSSSGHEGQSGKRGGRGQTGKMASSKDVQPVRHFDSNNKSNIFHSCLDRGGGGAHLSLIFWRLLSSENFPRRRKRLCGKNPTSMLLSRSTASLLLLSLLSWR